MSWTLSLGLRRVNDFEQLLDGSFVTSEQFEASLQLNLALLCEFGSLFIA
jgi:hypothetical protein